MAEPQPFLKSGLITLLAGISATGAFVTTGFIAAFGREQLQGVGLTDWSAETLTVLAGRCAADSFFLLLNLMARHWVLLTVILVLVGTGVVALRHRVLPVWIAPAAECVLAVPLLTWLLLVIVNFEAPTIPLRGWIVSPDLQSPLTTAIYQLHPRVAGGDRKATQTYVQNALSQPAGSRGANRLSDFSYVNRPDSPAVLLLESSSDDVGKQLSTIGFPYHPRYQARNLLYSGYASAVAVCFLSLLYVLLSRQCPESRIWTDLLVVLRTAIIVASVIATVLLPYVYGKVVDSTLFPNADITYEQPPTDAQTTKPTLTSGQFPVISQNDTYLSLLWVQAHGGNTQVIQVPRARIVSLDFVADVDALSKISKCMTQPEADCQ